MTTMPTWEPFMVPCLHVLTDDRARATWQNRLRDGLAATRDRGEILASADLDALALGLLAATQGGLRLAQATRSVRPLQVALDMALEQVHPVLGRWGADIRTTATGPAPPAARQGWNQSRLTDRRPEEDM